MDATRSTALGSSFKLRRFFVAWAAWSVLMPFVAGLATLVGTSGRGAPDVALSLAYLPFTVLGWAMLIPLDAVAGAVTFRRPVACRAGPAALLPAIAVFLAAAAVVLIGLQFVSDPVSTGTVVSLLLTAVAGGGLFAALLVGSDVWRWPIRAANGST